jgi:hypothetical protein
MINLINNVAHWVNSGTIKYNLQSKQIIEMINLTNNVAHWVNSGTTKYNLQTK